MNRHYVVAAALGVILCLPAIPAVLAQGAAAAGPSSLMVTGDVGKSLSLTPAQLKAMTRTRVEVKGEDDRTVAYEGVLVGEILKLAGATLGADLRGNAVATYVVASASDG